MPLTPTKKELIAHAVIKVLFSRFASFPENADNIRNAPFHTAFLNAFQTRLDGRVVDIPNFISLSSWMHGLNTALGSFFESVAHILSDGEKRTFINKDIYINQVNVISEIMIELKNGTRTPCTCTEDFLVASQAEGEKQTASKFTVDCLFITDEEVVAIELKSVRPNSGEMRGEKQKILQSKAVLKLLYPNLNIKYLFGFPFDPTAGTPTGYDKSRFLKYLVEAEKFCAPEEVLLANELWTYLSGCDTAMEEILTIINTIATSRFMEYFECIQNITPQNCGQYKELLESWFLYSELEIIDRIPFIRESSDRKILNQTIFKSDGSYNSRRLSLLY